MSGLELKFRLGGIPVRVEPGFWLLSAVLGWTGRGVREVLVWVACVFVGVLLHELGHAAASRAMGGKPEITLYAMGGVTHTHEGAHRPGSLLISLAGPVAGFVFGACVFVAAMLLMASGAESLGARAEAVWNLVTTPAETLGDRALQNLLWINVGWGLVNLAPVLPLDGGNVARVLLGPEETGWGRALVVSVVVGPLLAIAAFVYGMTWAAMLFALFSISDIRQWLDLRARRSDRAAGLDGRLQQAVEALELGQFERAAELARPVARARNASLRYSGANVLAIGLLESGHAEEACAVLRPIPAGHTDELLVGTALLAAGKPGEALGPLEAATRAGDNPRAWELLADAYEQTGEVQRAREARDRVQGSSMRGPDQS